MRTACGQFHVARDGGRRLSGPTAPTLMSSIQGQDYLLMTGMIAARVLGVESHRMHARNLRPITLFLPGGPGGAPGNDLLLREQDDY